MNASAVILNVFCSAFILLATLWVCIIDGVECWEESRWKRILHKFSRKERKNEMTRHQSGKGVNSRPHSNVRLKISLDFHIQPKSKTKHQAKKKLFWSKLFTLNRMEIYSLLIFMEIKLRKSFAPLSESHMKYLLALAERLEPLLNGHTCQYTF